MIPILYQSVTEGTVPNDYGIGALTDCLSCEVKEERNGSYELTLVYASKGIHAEEIQPNRVIKAKPNYNDNPQLFRIYKVGKEMNGRFEVNAQHISYDLSGFYPCFLFNAVGQGGTELRAHTLRNDYDKVSLAQSARGADLV